MTARLFAALLVIGCGGSAAAPDCGFYQYQSQFAYVVAPQDTTPEGIQVDSSGRDFDLDAIDRLTDEVESCVAGLVDESGRVREEAQTNADCRIGTAVLPIPRECMVVKIPSEILQSCDGKQELLPDLAPPELCIAKGADPTPECPFCRWRAGIQSPDIIVATPNLALYKDPLVRMITGCNNPWGNPMISACATNAACPGGVCAQ